MSLLPAAAQRGEAAAKLAVADQDSPAVHLYDVRSGSEEPLQQIEPHRAPVQHMQYNSAQDVVVSVDAKGGPRCISSVLLLAHLWLCTCGVCTCGGQQQSLL